MKAIPVAETDSPREILRSLMVARKALEEGELVCLFAEGQISRTGNLLEFKRGFEVIVKGLDVPIIPVNLDRVWGSIFSYEHGKVIWKKPRRIPYPVTVTFGEPLHSPTAPSQVRQAVLDLGAEAFRYRLENLETLPLEFLRRAKKQPLALAVADSSGQALSFGKLAAVSGVAARALEELIGPNENIGILLPPSVGAVVANLAVSMVGRTPVNLNYTADMDALRQALQRARITCVLTTPQMLQKTGLGDLTGTLDVQPIFDRLSASDIALERALLSLLPLRVVCQRLAGKAPRSLQKTATILFSSGSTGAPKGVVLSHANILANVLGLSQVFDLGKTDRMIGVLPFFHSFGFTATLWFPLINGFSAVYHANPLDAKAVGELIEKYRASLLLSTPTFLLAYIRRCTKDQFRSLRSVITGAEHLRESIAKAFEEKFGKTPLEGYGATELSPVATVNVPNVSMGETVQVGHKPGKIGHPIPGVTVSLVDPVTFEPVPQGQTGLLLVKGANVMQGYLDDPQKTAEVFHDGWYITGDIARVDEDGFVQLVDRLSRFSKIGGEMVPHLRIEDVLHQIADRHEPTFVVTGVPDEQRGERLVVLYAGWEGSVEELWRRLNDTNLPKLWIPAKNDFYRVESLPYLGTGKLDLAEVRRRALEKSAKPV